MEAIEIIEYLREQNFTVRADGEYLELSPAEKITNALIERLHKHKPAIIEVLKREQREQSQKIEIIQAWLFKIGEPEEDHYLVIDKCKCDPDAMEYFLNHTRGEYKSVY